MYSIVCSVYIYYVVVEKVLSVSANFLKFSYYHEPNFFISTYNYSEQKLDKHIGIYNSAQISWFFSILMKLNEKSSHVNSLIECHGYTME